jgi:hypothetical protein
MHQQATRAIRAAYHQAYEGARSLDYDENTTDREAGEAAAAQAAWWGYSPQEAAAAARDAQTAYAAVAATRAEYETAKQAAAIARINYRDETRRYLNPQPQPEEETTDALQ